MIGSLIHSYRRFFFSLLLNIKLSKQTFVTAPWLQHYFTKDVMEVISNKSQFPHQHQIGAILVKKKTRFFTELQIYAISKFKYQFLDKQHELTAEIIQKFGVENLTKAFVEQQSSAFNNLKEYVLTTFSYKTKKYA